jgi:SMI1/KNR4 family protein SUKH-1
MPRHLLDRVEVVNWGEGVPLLISSGQDLQHFEQASGIKLPSSYKAFATKFGAGELAGYYRIAVPSDVDNDYSLACFNLTSHGTQEEALWDGYASAEVIPHLLFFAATIGGEKYAWNTLDIRDRAHNEYGILFFPKSRQGRVVANSFTDFIEDVCLSQDPEEGESPPRLEFLPFSST